MARFRGSFSVLDTWSKGSWDKATMMYFKLEGFMTEAMAEGKDYHEKWAEEIKATKKLPEVFGAGELKNPVVETKKVIRLSDWLELVGIPDCVDGKTIYEFKTGVSDSDVYARGWQGMVYQVLCHENKPTQFHIHHYNQHTRQADMSIVHLTRNTFRNGVEWIVTTASEMHNYFLENNLYEVYGKR